MCIADYFDLVDKVDNELTALIMKFSETDVNLKYASTPYIESTHFFKWGLTHPPTPSHKAYNISAKSHISSFLAVWMVASVDISSQKTPSIPWILCLGSKLAAQKKKRS